MLPPIVEPIMDQAFITRKLSQKYRLKAIVCEKLSRDATSSELKAGWSEIAIEWHALASRIAQDVSLDHELEFS
jgi:hypothetical protein